MKLSECLRDLQLTASDFDDCDDLDQELKVIRKAYFKQVRTAHPVSRNKISFGKKKEKNDHVMCHELVEVE